MMGAIIDDFRLALRGVARSPGYADIAVLTLALGIGATTAIFSVVNGIFLRPLPYPEPTQLVQPRTVFADGFQGSFSYPDFEDLRDQNRTLTGLAAYTIRTTSAATAEQGFRVGWAQVSPGFLSVIGVPPALGRGFTADEEETGTPVALVSYGYWQSRLSGRRDFASQSVRVNDRAYAVIGVRVALGARRPDVVRLFVREGAVFAVGGVAIGLAVAIASARAVAAWLYGVGAIDPMTLAAVAVAMMVVVLAASWVPAYRASRTDAMEALRHD